MGNYSPHVSKIALHREHSCCWSSDASLRIYWGLPGDKDLTDFGNALFAARGTPVNNFGLSDPGYTKAFQESIFLSYALNYQPNERMICRLDLYNILGWFDQDLNKRNFILRGSDYRSEAAAIAATVRLTY